MTEKVKKDFKQWAIHPHENEYKQYKLKGARLLIRLYFYDGRKDKKDVLLYTDMVSDKTLQEDLSTEIFPIVKILGVGGAVTEEYQDFKPGDLGCIQDFMMDSSLNPEWIDYRAGIKEKPSLAREIEEPPQYLGHLAKWKQYVFLKDKFSGQIDMTDAYTFLVPESFVQSGYESI